MFISAITKHLLRSDVVPVNSFNGPELTRPNNGTVLLTNINKDY